MRKIKILLLLSLIIGFFACKESSKSEISKVITVEEAHRALASDMEYQLIDVRTVDEFKEGHLPGAVNICVTDDNFEKQLIHLDKNKPVYLYCRSGKRSARAAEILTQKGFKEIYDVKGGIQKWQEEGFEIQD
ncbi:MAG TPA: rhodanese-like domain-containing protein [Flavobacteriaceae bacterium]|nr:rhodanese-like domain-containing protein [Flavobacteriaceae bacterium]